ncbi:MAG TPA: DNA repair exonuclease [Candidatus Hydrogenedentes bacterium]|nr:DNA repair exonuclease [Candidatus Hydrogenedentota bacterium]
MSVKLLHTADWQMGMKALHAGQKAKDVRAKRYETAERIVELAKREGVDFVLLAGDLFEHHDVDDSVVRKTVAVLDNFAPIPVFVLPGNHDPHIAGGVWDRQSWQRVGNHVTLLHEAGEVRVRDDVALYPAPLKQKQSALDPTERLPVREADDTRIRIGIAHGALDVLPERTNFPIAATRADTTGLDYLALGDWHGFAQHGRSVYSGTMEQSSFTENDPGNVVIVEISGSGAEPIVSKHRVGGLVWTEYAPLIRDESDVEQLRKTVFDAGPLLAQLIRITPQIDPDVSASVLEELRSLRDELEAEAFFLDWPAETLDASPLTLVTIPEGLLLQVGEDLGAILDGRLPAGPGREFAVADPETVKEARVLLHRLVREVQP